MQPKWEAPQPASGQLVTRNIEGLRLHPSYVRLRLAPTPSQISSLLSGATLDPLVVNHQGIVLDGHARLEIARQRGLKSIACLEYPLGEEESILWILARHQRLEGFNSFIRIALALELESWFQRKALLNQRRGGFEKGSLNLTEAERLDVRCEVSKAAGASTGNVTKVKQILDRAHADVVTATRSGEVRIHRAWFLNCGR
jgi:hypothetical protein